MFEPSERRDAAEVLSYICALRQARSAAMLDELVELYDPFNPDDETIFEIYQANGRTYREAVWATEWAELELMEKEQKLTQLQQEMSSQLMEMEDQMKLTLRDSILSYLKNHHGENADIILDYSSNSSVLMVQDSLDLTNIVLKGLNDEYLNRNKKKK